MIIDKFDVTIDRVVQLSLKKYKSLSGCNFFSEYPKKNLSELSIQNFLKKSKQKSIKTKPKLRHERPKKNNISILNVLSKDHHSRAFASMGFFNVLKVYEYYPQKCVFFFYIFSVHSYLLLHAIKMVLISF